MKRTLVGAWLVSVLLVWVPAVSAQIEQGRLSGNVKDTQGGVLPGVTVTATSPALIGSRAAVTETDGQFLLANLPSGVYTLRFELPGFQTVLRENIRLSQGSTLISGTTFNRVIAALDPRAVQIAGRITF